ncbi:hypothetical protein ACJZ2D_013578 [Fusarium nematophilum]
MKLLLLLGCLLGYAAAQDVFDIEEVCYDVTGVLGCDQHLLRPTHGRPKYCTVNGVREQCGVNIAIEWVNICTAINRALQDDGEWTNAANTNCGCLPTAQRNHNERFGEGNLIKYIWEGYLSYDINTAVLSDLILTDLCMINHEPFYYVNNKTEVIKTSLAPKDGWTVLQLAEVDLSMYRLLVARTWVCSFDIDNCDQGLLAEFFADYIKASKGVTQGQLVKDLRYWLTLYDSIHKRIAAVNKAANLVQYRLGKVSSKVSAVRKSVCQKNACKGKTASSYLSKVSAALSMVKGLRNIPAAGSNAAKNIPKSRQLINQSIRTATTPASENYYFELFETANLGRISELPKAFELVSYFPRAAGELKKLLVPISDFTKHEARGRKGLAALNGVLTQNWSKNKELSKTKAGQKIGAAPVPRESIQNMNVPCVRDKTETFESNGWTDDITYREVYSCGFGPNYVDLPNHFIPWIRYRFK